MTKTAAKRKAGEAVSRDQEEQSTKFPLTTTQMFMIGLAFNCLVLYSFPALSEDHKNKLLRFPKSGDDVRGMYEVFKHYTQTSYWLLMLAFISTYVK